MKRFVSIMLIGFLVGQVMSYYHTLSIETIVTVAVITIVLLWGIDHDSKRY